MIKIFKSKNIIPMTAPDKNYSYLITKGKKILILGDKIPAEYSAIPVEDFGDSTITPAFFDTHVHYSSYGFCANSLPIMEAHSIDETLSNIGDYITNNKQKNYLLFGFSPHRVKERRLLKRSELDSISGDRPLLIAVYDGHSALANTAMIEACPIKDTRGFDKEKGHYFFESFYEVYKKASKMVSPIEFFRGLKIAENHFLNQGVTTVTALQGEGMPINIDLKAVRVFSKWSDLRIIPYFQTRSISAINRSRLKTWGGCFECALDGSPSGFDMASFDPYLVDTPFEGNRGMLFYDPNELGPMIKHAEKKGIQLAIHAIGDRAIDETLKVFERNISKENPLRHRIEHGVFLNDNLIERIARYNIQISTQPGVLGEEIDPLWLYYKILGQKRVEDKFLPLKKMVDAGINISGSSDAPVSIPNPLSAMRAAVHHFNPLHSISPYEALKMYTSNAAELMRMEDKLGTLVPGKEGDFVVLDKNPLEALNSKEEKISVKATYIKGQKV